jgi:lipopolysaccharide/colanic/teichoic acid biosynthesis glycosyltransferase
MTPRRRPGKRLFDVVVSGAILGASLPVLAVASLAIAADGGPVLFCQERVGRHGRRFRMLKLRTMRHRRPEAGPALTVGDDDRVTPVGRWLRAMKVDELPQLWNVLRGDMSLVGPRPEVPQYVDQYGDAEREVLDFLPGITDPASIRYRNESALLAQAADPEEYYRRVILPDKLRLSIDYGKKATFVSDILVIVRTIAAVVLPGSPEPTVSNVGTL